MKKNVAGQKVGCQLVSATDGSAVTTGTTTVYVTGDAGTQAAGSVGSGAATHEGNGYWTYAPAQSETNYDLAAFTFVNSSAVPATVQIYTSFPQTGDSYARLGAPAGADIATDIAALPTAAENADAVWDEARSGHVTAGTFGGDAVDAPTNFASLGIDASGNLSGSVASVVGAVGSVTGNVGGNVAGSVASVTAGVTLDAAAVDAIWDEAQSGHTTAGTFGKFLDAAVSGVSTGGVSAVDIATAVWDEALSGHATAGTSGKALSDTLTDAVAIKAKTDNLPSDPADESLIIAATDAISTSIAGLNNLSQADVRTAVGLASANLDTQLDALPTATENADALLKRDWTSVTGEAARSVLNALRALRNKVSRSGTTLTVTKEDDATSAWTATLTTDAAAEPVTSQDPA